MDGRRVQALTMRAQRGVGPALLVGLASIPLGFLWISRYGSGKGTTLLLAGVAVGLIYTGRPTDVRVAGVLAGVPASVPEVIAQYNEATINLGGIGGGLAVDVAVYALLAFVVVTILIVPIGFVTVIAVVTASFVRTARTVLAPTSS